MILSPNNKKPLEIGHYHGTEQYHSLKPLFKTVVTDGVKYVMDNDYSWFVTDSIAVIEHSKSIKKLFNNLSQGNLFLHITLDATDEDDIQMIIDDGDENILYIQNYPNIIADYSLPNDKLELYWVKGSHNDSNQMEGSVCMLVGEY